MKKAILSIAIFALTFISSSEVFAQKFPKMDVSPMDVASYPNNWRESNKLVKIVYSRPQLKGRDLAKLAPNDKVWRTGANEAAEITFYKDVNFGGSDVKAGTYTLFTIPSDSSWTIILSNHKNIWGSYFYKKEFDVARVPAKVSKFEESVEAFSIVFEGDEGSTKMHLGWANTIVSVSVNKLNPDSKPIKG